MDFTDLLLNANSRDEIDLVLAALLTDKERESIQHRLEVVKMLLEGVPHRKIADTLGVGIATVTRGAAEMKRGKFAFLNDCLPGGHS